MTIKSVLSSVVLVRLYYMMYMVMPIYIFIRTRSTHFNTHFNTIIQYIKCEDHSVHTLFSNAVILVISI